LLQRNAQLGGSPHYLLDIGTIQATIYDDRRRHLFAPCWYAHFSSPNQKM
jgi:hypothetical protein